MTTLLAGGSNLRRGGTSQTVVLVLGLAVLIAISAVSVYFIAEARRDAEWVTHTVEVSGQISTVQLLVRRAESAERGFVITRRDNDRADFEQAVADLPKAIDQLAAMTRDNSEQQSNLQELRTVTDARVAQMRRSIELSVTGRADQAAAALRDSADRQLMTSMRAVAERMRSEEDRLLVLRYASVDRSQQIVTAVTTTGSGVVIALAAFSILQVRRASRARDEIDRQARELNTTLETTVSERTADLREANEEIQRFAYIVSHDLRSPLVNIMGFTSELEELRGDIFRRIADQQPLAAGIAPPLNTLSAEPQLSGEDQRLSDDFTEALGFIKSSIGKMDRLIGAILQLTREGQRKFRPVQIDLNELLQGIVSSVAHQAAESETTIRIEALPDITCDRLALEQIFSNLVDNAIKYLKNGVPGEIVITGRRKLGFAVIDVADNGRGIDAKDYQRIFDLFRRAGAQDKPGQGIGLAHVRALVRRMGGTLNVASELNKGSTFTVTLPINWIGEQKGQAA